MTITRHTLWRILFHALAIVRTVVHFVTEGMVLLGEGLVTCSEYSIVSDPCFEFRNGFTITLIVNASFLLNGSSERYLILDGPIGPIMY